MTVPKSMGLPMRAKTDPRTSGRKTGWGGMPKPPGQMGKTPPGKMPMPAGAMPMPGGGNRNIERAVTRRETRKSVPEMAVKKTPAPKSGPRAR